MDIWQAIVLGVVEGLTEYLPVSSTGHLILAQRAMGIEAGEAANAYAICIQGGAILAVLVLYWRRMRQMLDGLVFRDERGRAGRALLLRLFVAVLPLFGVVFVERLIKEHLFGLWPTSGAWIVGGVVILVVSFLKLDRDRPARPAASGEGEISTPAGKGLEDMAIWMALVIGLAQCIAVWPGTSRSLVTILAGVLIGLRLVAAVEFSFLLGVITLSAATLKDGLDYGEEMLAAYTFTAMAVGFVVAFVSAVVAVKWMVSYLQKHGLAVFGWYRVALGAVVLVLLATGQLQN